MGKVSDQITEFTETYSAILVGIHADMNQYRNEVKSVKKNTSLVNSQLSKTFNSTKAIEESNIRIASKIEDRKSEIEQFYREIAGSTRRLKIIAEDLEKTKSFINQLNSKLNQVNIEISRLNTKLIEEQGKNLRIKTNLTKVASDLSTASNQMDNLNQELDGLKNVLEKQREQLVTQKLLIIGCFALIAFILVLTLLL
ncbi:hypothetical protein [Salegentibacter mishustinae]|uniref:hypothetical protein n=1 Tax=Salegentibacter mishustinae TaxID=270918 RepID=UPI00248FA54C|nr:hypothetical protein [Salegentibacter mishustinae]